MLLQTNSYVVPKERRAEHQRLLRRFRQTLARLGCEHFEAYEQVGPNWNTGDSTGRYVQIMRFRDRRHQLAVQSAERADPGAQAVIAEFCNMINFPYQQQQGLFAVGFYQSALPVTLRREATRAEVEASDGAMQSAAAESEETDDAPLDELAEAGPVEAAGVAETVEAEADAGESEEPEESEAETESQAEEYEEESVEAEGTVDSEEEAEAEIEGSEATAESEDVESSEAGEGIESEGDEFEEESEAEESGEPEEEAEAEGEETGEPKEEAEAEGEETGETEEEAEVEGEEFEDVAEADADESGASEEETEADGEEYEEAVEAGVASEIPRAHVKPLSEDELFDEQASDEEEFAEDGVAAAEPQLLPRQETEVEKDDGEAAAGAEVPTLEELDFEIDEAAKVKEAPETENVFGLWEPGETEAPSEQLAAEAKVEIVHVLPIDAVDEEDSEKADAAEVEAVEDKLFWDDEEELATAPIARENIEAELGGETEAPEGELDGVGADPGTAPHATVEARHPAEEGMKDVDLVGLAFDETAATADEEAFEPADDDATEEAWGELAPVEGAQLSAEEGDIEIVYEQLPGTADESPEDDAAAGGPGAAHAGEVDETGFDALLSNEQLLEDIDSEEALDAGARHTAELHSQIHGPVGRNGNSLTHAGVEPVSGGEARNPNFETRNKFKA